ncbi:hypothetical protein QTP70_001060 [Hemibagrus guttatus]|uniref:Uncharacterized protein n=1 Tax=Hemibagrus guttatus TaxID=175788 RepID=A0AAE0UX21_9TELE|nr:hypothetical protein QTP70_001060 [Hemibagrus guttatus]KAK3549448.1 hypothetical protein QTP86_001452 [Hemibagrus guttatus]
MGSITDWFGNSTKQDRQALQRVVRSAKCTIRTELPDLETMYSKRCWTKARKIMKDLSHPNNGLFTLLRYNQIALDDKIRHPWTFLSFGDSLIFSSPVHRSASVPVADDDPLPGFRGGRRLTSRQR